MRRMTGAFLLSAGLLVVHGSLAQAQSLFRLGNRGPTPVQSSPRLVPQPTKKHPMSHSMTQMIVEPPIELASMQAATVRIDATGTATNAATRPTINLVNSRSLVLDFEVKETGPSGLSNIQLWYTRNGQIWHKHAGIAPTQGPIAVDVAEDGLYGFTVVASNGVGLGKAPPQPGDPPQIWVEVDTTKPEVHLLGTQAGADENGRTLSLRWTAMDKNLVARPITLLYADNPQGPWTPFATNLENNGVYVWQMSPGLPPQVLVKVAACDRVGNLGDEHSSMPAPIDLNRPNAAITRVNRNGVVIPVSDR